MIFCRTRSATSLDGAKNAGILAAQIIALNDNNVANKLIDYKSKLQQKVFDSEKDL